METHIITPAPLLTPAEFAAKYRVSRSAVYNWVGNGTLPFIRIGAKILIAEDTMIPARATNDDAPKT
jgi:excisionase family DNA binding protein